MSDRAEERLRRWRLALGEASEPTLPSVGRDDQRLDHVLGQLYDAETHRSADLAGSAPDVARWLGDIRTYFPTSIVRVMQRDALERLGLKQLLLEPELLSEVEPDIHLVTTLMSLSRVIPSRTRETARYVVRQVVEDIERRLAEPIRQSVHGALSRAIHNRQTAFARNRLAADRPREPPTLFARAADRGSGTTRRVWSATPADEGRDCRGGPERLDG